MLDINFIRENPDVFDMNIARRGHPPCAQQMIRLDQTVRALKTQIQQLEAERHREAQQFETAGTNETGRNIKAQIQAFEIQYKAAAEELTHLLITLPNLLMADVPDGQDDRDNPELTRWGTPRDFTFTPKNHFTLGEDAGGMDFKTAAKLSGARFTLLRGGLARLHRALGQFTIDLHVDQHGFEEVDVPLMVRPASMAATTHLPKFDNGFRTVDDYWLIPSAEVPLINLYRDMILDAARLPIRVAAMTPCFRSEAGSAGRDTQGMLRQHQFYKTELVTITHPDRWREAFDYTVACAETVLRKLDLPYRTVQLCAGDCAIKEAYGVDAEVWMPGQNRYREVCTWACTGDYQSRRANIRMNDGARRIHPYIIYGSGTAIGRTFIAVVENYQQENGKITIPDVLRPYMGGMTQIG